MRKKVPGWRLKVDKERMMFLKSSVSEFQAVGPVHETLNA